MNNTPRGNRVHIGLFGKRNAGKSSLINAITNQKIALVSSELGTTTDPVYKSMELLPIGPVVMIDTAGLDDEGELGKLRIEKTNEVINKTDIALIVVDALAGITDFERNLIEKLKTKKTPIVGVYNKIDTLENDFENQKIEGVKFIGVSCLNGVGVVEVKRQIINFAPQDEEKFRLVGDLVSPGDFVVLVTPIDKAAPKGRLILPQQQVIRDCLESDAIVVVTKEHELKHTLENLGKKPSLVITDSQAFLKVSADTPKDIPLTSFSILMARYKGDLVELIKGVNALKNLNDGDKVLIAEGCTHHRQSDDIGTVKIPRWLKQYVGKRLVFEFSSGYSYPDNLDEFAVIIHCGACMLNNKEMLFRIEQAKEKEIPIINYGIFISYVQGIFDRALEPFPRARMIYKKG